MTIRLRSWSERVHEASCPDCRRRADHRRLMADCLEMVYPEPPQEQIDAWLIGMTDEPGGEA